MEQNSGIVAHQPPVSSAFEFTYQIQLTKLSDCPPPLQSGEKNGFRFASADKLSDLNFLPVALITPARLPKLNNVACCSAYGLSMFDTRANLTKKAQLLLKSHPNIFKLLGDHFIEVALASKDGRHTEKNQSGHFDFHSYTNFHPTNCVLNHGKILP